MRSGRGAWTWAPWCLRKAMASTPSTTTCSWMALLASRKASCVNRTSPGLSSTKRTCMGMPSSPIDSLFSLATCQSKAKGGAVPKLRFDRNAAAVSLDDFFADGQSNPGAGELFPFVQPLEHAENSFEILRIDSNPVVFHREGPFPVAVHGSRNVYMGGP